MWTLRPCSTSEYCRGISGDSESQRRGPDSLCGDLPQYLIMDESRYALPRKRRRRYMIAPPLPEKERSGGSLESTERGQDPDDLHRPLQLYHSAERGRSQRLLKDTVRDARSRGTAGLDLSIRSEYRTADSTADVQILIGKPGEALSALSAERSFSSGQ